MMAVVVVATVRGVVQQTDEIGGSVDAAMANASTSSTSTKKSLDDARAAVEATSPAITEGFVTKIVSGVNALIGAGQRPDPRRADHVLPAQGRHQAPALPSSADRPLDPRRRRQLHHRRVPDPPRLRAGPHRHVRDRRGGHRRRQPPARPSARFHDRGRELHRRLHPVHRRLSRRRARRDRRSTATAGSIWPS